MNANTSLLNSDNDLEKKIKTSSNYYTNPLKTKKLKKEITAKVGTKYETKDEKNKNAI